MKTIAAILALTISFLTGETMTTDHNANPQVNQVTAPATNASISYETVQSPYSKEVQASLQAIRLTGGTRVVVADKTYVIISLGKRNTGGYKVVVDGIEKLANGNFVVKAHEVKPQPGMMTTQAITYPSVVIALPATNGKVTVDLK